MKEVPEDTVIWRYMNFTKFVLLLEKHELFFCRPASFQDPWESHPPPCGFNRKKRICEESLGGYLEEDQQDDRRHLMAYRYGHFVNCWHMGIHESDAMWKLYGLAPEGVAIKSTFGDCVKNMDVQGAAVRYYDPNDEAFVIEESKFFLYKRDSFDWEKEVRFWDMDLKTLDQIQENPDFDPSGLSTGEYQHIENFQEMIHKVVVAPGAAPWFFDLVKAVCVRRQYNWLADRVERSNSDLSWNDFID